MCGIFGYLRFTGSDNDGDKGDKCDCGKYVNPQLLYESFEKIRPRGPDRSTFHEISEYGQMIYLGFQRLAIMDPTTDGDQPFTLEKKKYDDNGALVEHRSIYVICNGEIYNHHELIKKYGYGGLMKGRSDCEFLPHFYAEHGIEKMAEDLRAESAICVLDIDRSNRTIQIHLVRDALSVRPLFIGMDSRGFGFCSELKGLTNIIEQDKTRQLRGGCRYEITIDLDNVKETTFNEVCYFDLNKYRIPEPEVGSVPEYQYEVLEMLEHIYPDLSDVARLQELDKVLTGVRETLEGSVVSMLESDVPMGSLLSGGVDSSSVVAIIAKHLRKKGKRLRTFSIGIPGATDQEFAEMVAREAGTDHTHVEFSIDDFINAIPHVIKAIGSYDITTVRASTGQWLITKWIHENTDIRVLFSGDGFDESQNGYRESYNSPSPIAIHNNSVMRLSDIGYFDALRSDEGTATNSIEMRNPGLHRDIVECVMKIDPRLKVPLSDNGLVNGRFTKRREKWLLRKAFDIDYEDFDGSMRPYLPMEVLKRSKEAFSDGVSSTAKSWYEIIQESIEDRYTQVDIDQWVETLSKSDTNCSPWTKEAVHYLEIFTKNYGNAYQVIPYYWMPSFTDAKDPSARTLSVYHDT
jgi:asparagine synthase (glutamine-hydrolysing)